MAKCGSSFKDFLYYIKSGKSLINGYTGLRNVRTAINNLNSIIDINCIGDSMTTGSGGCVSPSSPYTCIWDNCFVTLLRNYFKNKFQDTGKNLVPAHWWYSPDHMIITWGGTWATHVQGDMGFGMYSLSTTAGATATFSFSGTGIRIYYVRGSTSSDFTVQIDGGTVNTITGNGTVDYAHYLEYTGLSDGEHIVILTNLATSGRANLRFLGYMPLTDATVGVRVNNMGAVGDGAYQNWTGALSHVRDSCTAIPAKLYILMIGANDKFTNVSIANFTTAVQDMITTCKASNGDVLVIIPWFTNTTGTYAWDLYADALLSLIKSNNIAGIDLRKVWNSSMIADTVHPNSIGHYDLTYNRILKALKV